MRLIRDIRLLEADWPNEDYFSLPSYMGNIFLLDAMDMLEVTERLVFLLRSCNFCFPGFDHLYLNFTTNLPHGTIMPSARTVCREDAWLRWVDIGCDREMFNLWTLEEKKSYVESQIYEAVTFMTEEADRELAATCIAHAASQRDTLEIPYRHKENDVCCLDIFVRITSEELDYIPVICITSKDGRTLIKEEMKAYGRDAFICQFSSISLGKQSLRILPRKSFESEFYGLKPIFIRWKTCGD